MVQDNIKVIDNLDIHTQNFFYPNTKFFPHRQERPLKGTLTRSYVILAHDNLKWKKWNPIFPDRKGKKSYC